MVQWLRLRVSMQGAWVQFLAGEVLYTMQYEKKKKIDPISDLWGRGASQVAQW